MSKVIAVSGAGGFLGSHLIRKISDDNEVYAITSKSELPANNIHIVGREEYSSIPWDQVSCLVNCAYPRNTDGVQIANGLKYISDLLSCAVESGVKSVINISSQSVYSQNRTQPAKESDPVCLESIYAVGKYSTELATNYICKEIPHTNLRMSSLIGPGFDQRVVNKLVKKALKGEQISLVKTERKHGFLDINDAVNAILLFLDLGIYDAKEVYNVGNGEAYTLETIVSEIQKTFLKNNISFPQVSFSNNDNKITNSAINYDRIEREYGYIPTMTLENSIQRILNYELNIRIVDHE